MMKARPASATHDGYARRKVERETERTKENGVVVAIAETAIE